MCKSQRKQSNRNRNARHLLVKCGDMLWAEIQAQQCNGEPQAKITKQHRQVTGTVIMHQGSASFAGEASPPWKAILIRGMAFVQIALLTQHTPMGTSWPELPSVGTP